MDKPKKKNTHISNLIRIAVAAGALYLAFRGQSVRELAKIFGELSPWAFAAGAGLYFFAQFVFVARWLTLLRTQSIKIKFLPALKLHFLGLFYNNCLPGSVGGDFLRAWYVTHHTDKKIEAAMSVFVDRAVGLGCTVAMIFIAYYCGPGEKADLQLSANFNLASLAVKAAIVLAAAVVLLVAAVMVMYKIRRLRGYLLKYAFIIAIKYKFWVSRITKAVKLYCCRPITFSFAVLLSFTCQSMAVAGLWLIGENLGISSPAKYYFVFFPLSWIIGVLPISVGGAGVMELGLKGMFAKVAAVSESQGLVLALSQRFIWLLTSVPGVFVHIFGHHLPGKTEKISKG